MKNIAPRLLVIIALYLCSPLRSMHIEEEQKDLTQMLAMKLSRHRLEECQKIRRDEECSSTSCFALCSEDQRKSEVDGTFDLAVEHRALPVAMQYIVWYELERIRNSPELLAAIRTKDDWSGVLLSSKKIAIDKDPVFLQNFSLQLALYKEEPMGREFDFNAHYNLACNDHHRWWASNKSFKLLLQPTFSFSIAKKIADEEELAL